MTGYECRAVSQYRVTLKSLDTPPGTRRDVGQDVARNFGFGPGVITPLRHHPGVSAQQLGSDRGRSHGEIHSYEG